MQRGHVKSRSNGFEHVLQVGGLAALLTILGGCGPALSKSDLGTVVFKVPKVAGTDKPYKMPKLGPPDKKSQEHLRARRAEPWLLSQWQYHLLGWQLNCRPSVCEAA